VPPFQQVLPFRQGLQKVKTITSDSSFTVDRQIRSQSWRVAVITHQIVIPVCQLDFIVSPITQNLMSAISQVIGYCYTNRPLINQVVFTRVVNCSIRQINCHLLGSSYCHREGCWRYYWFFIRINLIHLIPQFMQPRYQREMVHRMSSFWVETFH